MIELEEADLLSRLHDFENPFVERKAGSDIKDCLKTAVAFANSLPIDAPGVLFVPVYNDGRVQQGQNLESLQKTISEQISRAYPPINYLPKILGSGSDQFLAVIIWGSAGRPHFAGPSYVREGAETKIANEKQFAELIVSRQSKVYEILRWKGRPISLTRFRIMRGDRHGGGPMEAQVEDCNQFFVTLKLSNGELFSEPMDRVTINYDTKSNRLWIEAELLQ
jgi:predicted HTH transcriptional regulator